MPIISGDFEKLQRAIKLPTLQNIKDVVQWSQDLNKQLTLILSKSAYRMNDTMWQLVHQKEFEANATTYDITNLDGDADIEYMIIARIIHQAGAVTANYSIRPNNDSGANYGYHTIVGSGGAASSSSGVNATALGIAQSTSNGRVSYYTGILYAKSGYLRTILGHSIRDISGEIIASIQHEGGVWNNTADNITSLRFHCDQANGWGIGTRIEIWTR